MVFFCRKKFYFAMIIGKNPQKFTDFVKNILYTRQGKTKEVEHFILYLDSYMVAAVWMYFLCLYLGGTIGSRKQRKLKTGRLVMAALLCSTLDVVAICLLCFGSKWFLGLTVGIAILEIPFAAGIAYGKDFLMKKSLLLFVITALFSGLFQIVPIKNVGLFCVVGTLLLPVLLHGISQLFRGKQTESMLYEANVTFHGKERRLTALMDTGNRLRMFGSTTPVVLVDKTYLTEWIKEAEVFSPQKLVYIPYKGVGGKGILQGVRVQCRITEEKKTAIEGEVAAVAAEHKLFHGCGYQMILQPEVLSLVCVRNTQEGAQNVI